MTTLGIIWFILIFVLIAGYFILDGFDLGAGVLSPFICKNDEEHAIVRQSIGPVWDGNEVWLLTAGGALFAAFAPAYATTFSGFYMAIFLVLMGLIVRAIALEFAAHDKDWSRIYNVFFFVGSLLPALLLGVAVGNVYAGIPLDTNGDYVGVAFLGLVTPFTLLTGLLGLVMFLAQGATWISLKAPKPSDLQARAAHLRMSLQMAVLVVFSVVSVYAHFAFGAENMAPELTVVRFICAFAVFGFVIASMVIGKKNDGDMAPFILQSASAAALIALWASSMFPNLVIAGAGDPWSLFTSAASGVNITIANAASSDLALAWMLGITAVGLPLVLIYHFIIYHTFRGRVKIEDLEY